MKYFCLSQAVVPSPNTDFCLACFAWPFAGRACFSQWFTAMSRLVGLLCMELQAQVKVSKSSSLLLLCRMSRVKPVQNEMVSTV